MNFFSHALSINGGDAPRQKSKPAPIRSQAAFLGVSPDHLCRGHKREKKFKSRGSIFFSFSVIFFLSSTAFALVIPDKPHSYVNDAANLLSDTARGEIEETLAQFEKETSNQVVVATFPSLENESLEDFSIHLAEKWKIGTKEHSNGVVLLIFRDDRKMRIEVGYGLEGALPDLVCDQIIRNEIRPAFREGNFDAGVMSGVRAILAATKGEYKASPANAQDQVQKHAPFIFVWVVFLVFILLRSFSFPGQTVSGRRRGIWGPGVFFGGGFGGSGFSGGGSFGGGGGGGFGGGGASGGW